MTDTNAIKHSYYPREPVIHVGIIDQMQAVAIRLEGTYRRPDGCTIGPSTLHVSCQGGRLQFDGAGQGGAEELVLEPEDRANCRFVLAATIGIDFHWEQTETQAFRGGLRLVARGEDHVTVINRVALETYITSVICSEMNASSPIEAIRTHAVISRSWLLAQLDYKNNKAGDQVRDKKAPTPSASPLSKPSTSAREIIRRTEREAHATYDVCADDHCQRYQGIGRTDSPAVMTAIAQTRGQVLMFDSQACDARFSKCCGGVTEQYQTAWGDKTVPYLVALPDAPSSNNSPPTLTDEHSVRAFIQGPPKAYCNCRDGSILERVLNDYDLKTVDFFRWQVPLKAVDASRLVAEKLGIDLGRIVAITPLERGPSGRLKRLRLTGESGSLIIGKELEIRRALSPTHLFSSAFVVDPQGPANRPDLFLLQGAGWGHGVGLCQIGAAVMACEGTGYREILAHYYPGTEVLECYA